MYVGGSNKEKEGGIERQLNDRQLQEDKMRDRQKKKREVK